MNIRLSRYVAPALLAVALPTVAVMAQTQNQPQPSHRGPSAETLTRLQDGRIAMIKESLKLTDAQLKLWAPVEQQLRASFEQRQKARAERRERRQVKAERPSLPDRLDRASERMAKRAASLKSYSDALRPFYDSLTDDQKAVASVVLRNQGGLMRGQGHGRRWSMRHHPRGERN